MELKSDLDAASEEKLLKLLREQDVQAQTGSEHVKSGPIKLVNPGERWYRILDIVQVVFKLFCLIAVIWGGYKLWTVLNSSDVSPRTSSTATVSSQRQGRLSGLVAQRFNQSFDRYESVFEQRDLFVSPAGYFGSAAKNIESPASNNLRTQLRLVGILIDENPQAMIEDSGSNQTHIVGVKQNVAGAILTEIHENRVVLEYNGERIELFH